MTGENKQQNSGLLGWLLFVVGFTGALFVGWVVFHNFFFLPNTSLSITTTPSTRKRRA